MKDKFKIKKQVNFLNKFKYKNKLFNSMRPE